MQQIREYFAQVAELSDEDWRVFSAKLTTQTFPAKSLLLKAGQTEDYLSFIKQGAVRFFIPKKETDLTFGFVFENNFLALTILF